MWGLSQIEIGSILGDCRTNWRTRDGELMLAMILCISPLLELRPHKGPNAMGTTLPASSSTLRTLVGAIEVSPQAYGNQKSVSAKPLGTAGQRPWQGTNASFQTQTGKSRPGFGPILRTSRTSGTSDGRVSTQRATTLDPSRIIAVIATNNQ